MKLTHAQLSLMEKLKAGDVLSGELIDSWMWRFSVLRDGMDITVRPVRIATILAMVNSGALIQIGSKPTLRYWQPTAEGLAAYRAEVGG